MSNEERIILDPAILSGKPIIRGTRLAVEYVIGLLAEGWLASDITDQYPGVTDADVLACLAYAREVMASERVYPTAA